MMQRIFATSLLLLLAACTSAPEPIGPSSPLPLEETQERRLQRLSRQWLPDGLAFHAEVPVPGATLLLVQSTNFKTNWNTISSGPDVSTAYSVSSGVPVSHNQGERALVVPAGLLMRHEAGCFMTTLAVTVPPGASLELPCISVSPGWEYQPGPGRAVFADWRLRAECFTRPRGTSLLSVERRTAETEAGPRNLPLEQSLTEVMARHDAHTAGVALVANGQLVAMDYFESARVDKDAIESMLIGYLAGVALHDLDESVTAKTRFVSSLVESLPSAVEETPLAEVMRALRGKHLTYLHPDIDGTIAVSGEIGSTPKSVAAFLAGLSEEGSRTWVCWHETLRLVPAGQTDEPHQSPIWQNPWVLEIAGRDDPRTRKDASLVKERAQSMTDDQRRALADHYADEMANKLESRMAMSDATSAILATADIAEALETMRVCAEAGVWTRHCTEICLWAQLLIFQARQLTGEELVGPHDAVTVRRSSIFRPSVHVTWYPVARPGWDTPAQSFVFD